MTPSECEPPDVVTSPELLSVTAPAFPPPPPVPPTAMEALPLSTEIVPATVSPPRPPPPPALCANTPADWSPFVTTFAVLSSVTVPPAPPSPPDPPTPIAIAGTAEPPTAAE